MATHSNILAGRILWREETLGYSPQGHKELNTSEASTSLYHIVNIVKALPVWLTAVFPEF